MPFTFHSHSGQFCKHGYGQLEETIQAAISKGMPIIGLTEHVPRWRAQDLYPEEQGLVPSDLEATFSAYVAEARQLQAKYQDKIEIVIGCESEYITQLDIAKAKDMQELYELDYIVGSVHHIDEIPMDFSAELYEQIVAKYNGDRVAVFQRYFELQYEMLQALQPTVVGHFDLVRIFHPQDQADPLLADAEVRALAERNIAYIVSYGGVVEVNSRAWKKGLRDAYPQRDLMQAILQRGGRITLSDDSHGSGDVAMHYNRLYAYLQEMHVEKVHCVRQGGRIEVFVGAMQDEFWAKNGLNK
ncbi:hypothetical protein FBU59_000708 [Linderina macrospora]|uniref:Uncharacterized protein n=1 Tax=Linderina macrospora TaxID=4868 RepID=A0ACC1JGA6_9FUNG|nr:hypothetical protein FBU59_000708 [Linderina macrospora]